MAASIKLMDVGKFCVVLEKLTLKSLNWGLNSSLITKRAWKNLSRRSSQQT